MEIISWQPTQDYLDGEEDERNRWAAMLEELRPLYEEQKRVTRTEGCPCNFCKARKDFVAEVGKLFERVK